MSRSVNLPLFDVSQESLALGKSLVDAAAEWGFLWIDCSGTDHDWFDDDLVDSVFDTSKEFFLHETEAEQDKCSIVDNKGMIKMNVESLDPTKHKNGDFKQAFNLAEPDGQGWRQPLPRVLAQRQDLLLRFHKACRRLSDRLLRLLAIGLGLSDPDWLTKRHAGGMNMLRLLHYPSLSGHKGYSPAQDIRAGAHSDYGSLTLLFQRPNQEGLQILTDEENGTWASVPIFPPNYHSQTLPPVVVNIGDLLSSWTNGILSSTIHRVVAGMENEAVSNGSGSCDRYSVACFIEPDEHTRLSSMPLATDLFPSRLCSQTVGRGGGAKSSKEMQEMTAGEYLQSRLSATYSKA